MSNETIFREVDEELRGDRMRRFWRRFGPYVIGAAVLVVLAVAANEGWRWWQNTNAARASDQYYAALDAAEKNDMAGAQKALDEVIASGNGGYPTLAKFREAALLAHQGNTAGAVAAYDALSTSESNQHLRELALVLAANLLVDNGDVAAVQQRVGGLVSPDNPMRNAARESIGLTQYKAGDLNAALATFNDIAADPLSSSDQQSRMRIYVAQLVALGALTPEQQAAAAAAPATPATAATTTAEAAAPAVTATTAPAEPTLAPMTTATPAPAAMQAAQSANPATTMQAPAISAPMATAAQAVAPAAPVAPAETPAVPAAPVTAPDGKGMQPPPTGTHPAVPMHAPASPPAM